MAPCMLSITCAKLDRIFFADGAGIRQSGNPRGVLCRTGSDMVEMEPMTLLPALAMVTNRIGLVTTASTTYNEPYNLARKFATLDLISNGRAGWNVVASWSEHEAQNFGLETTLDYDTRYARSAEFVEVVKGLWDSWEDGAMLYDKATGRYFDESRMHVLNHRGRFFNVRGPLNVAGMPQGHPVIVQVGASEQGREFGAATAEVIYVIQDSLQHAQGYYADVKGRMAKYGREPDDLKIMPAICPVVGRTCAEAQAKFDRLQALIDPLVGLGRLYSSFGDLSGLSAGRSGAGGCTGQAGVAQPERAVGGTRAAGEADDPRVVLALRHHRLRENRHARRHCRCHAGMVRRCSMRRFQRDAGDPARRRRRLRRHGCA
jgi:FMN-dependent oxidoreductase (nitrilotriacetate monooxygenase family)